MGTLDFSLMRAWNIYDQGGECATEFRPRGANCSDRFAGHVDVNISTIAHHAKE
jgi:hypothetical protein